MYVVRAQLCKCGVAGHLPDMDLLIVISSPSSRFQVTTGLGEPRALHLSFTLLLSWAITSPELSVSTISGGTVGSRTGLYYCQYNAYWFSAYCFTLLNNYNTIKFSEFIYIYSKLYNIFVIESIFVFKKVTTHIIVIVHHDFLLNIYYNLKYYILPTTVRYPATVMADAVLIWHMYLPVSVSLTLAMCRYQVFWCLSCVTLIRSLRVMTWLATVRIAEFS